MWIVKFVDETSAFWDLKSNEKSKKDKSKVKLEFDKLLLWFGTKEGYIQSKDVSGLTDEIFNQVSLQKFGRIKLM